MSTAGARQIDAMIVGAQKAGTSSLAQYMRQHPDLCTHPRPELSYFVDDPDFRLGYAANFRRNFSHCPADAIIFGKSATLMTREEYVDRLFACNPAMRVIVVLRNPVDRAYSAYWWARRKGLEDEPSFEAALRETARGRNDDIVRLRSTSYLAAGEYASQVATLFERFGRSQVQVHLFDDLRSDARAVCLSVFRFLDVDPFEPDVSGRENEASRARSTRIARALTARHPLKRAVRRVLPPRLADDLRVRLERMNAVPFRHPPMDEATRSQLIAHFVPHNEELGRLIDRDLTAWNASPATQAVDASAPVDAR